VVRRSGASMSGIDQHVQARLAEAQSRIHAAVEDAIAECAAAAVEQARADCPVASGRLRDSIGSEVRGDAESGVIEGRVYAAAPYAAAVELGLGGSPAQPFLLPAAEAEGARLRSALAGICAD
jgi:hypothetical protein